VARRELLEEAGVRYVGQFYTSNGISNPVAYVYLATGVGSGEAQRALTELMEIRLVPVEEAPRMAREGEISDGPSALALLLCLPLLDQDLAPDQVRQVPGRGFGRAVVHWAYERRSAEGRVVNQPARPRGCVPGLSVWLPDRG